MKKYILDNINREILLKISRIHCEVPALWIENYVPSESDIKGQCDRIIETLNEKRTFIKVIEDNNKLIAFIWADVNEEDNKIINIMSLWTSPDFRHKGYAYELKKDLEEWGRSIGAKKIITDVSVKNSGMYALNNKLGYKTDFVKMKKAPSSLGITNSNITIVEDSEEDVIKFISEIRTNLRQEWEDDFILRGSEEIGETYIKIMNQFKEGKIRLTIIKNDEKIAALMWVKKLNHEEVKIKSLWISPEFRRKGLAQNLKFELENWCCKKGIKMIYTAVDPLNKNMIKLNEKLGYNPYFYKMSKEL